MSNIITKTHPVPDMHSVPISTNIATAEVLLRGLDQGDLDYREGIHPDIVEPLPVHRAVC